MELVVIDGQGGGFGRALIAQLRCAGYKGNIAAVGTNSMATSAMLKAGATAGATGENAVIVNARRARIIAGPIGIVLSGSLMGECSAAMAAAVAESDACKVLIPVSTCGVQVASTVDLPLGDRIADAAQRILKLLCQE